MLLSKWGSSYDNFVQLMGVLLIFVVVLLAVWLVIRWMGGLQKIQFRNQRNLRLLDSIRVGNNKMISVIRAGGAYYVVAVGKDEIHLLGELTEQQAKVFAEAEDRMSLTAEAGTSESFTQMLDRMKGKLSKKQDEP